MLSASNVAAADVFRRQQRCVMNYLNDLKITINSNVSCLSFCCSALVYGAHIKNKNKSSFSRGIVLEAF